MEWAAPRGTKKRYGLNSVERTLIVRQQGHATHTEIRTGVTANQVSPERGAGQWLQLIRNCFRRIAGFLSLALLAR